MMLKKLSILSGLLLYWALPAQAVDCGRPSTIVESTVCDVQELSWLDRVFSDAFTEKVMQDPTDTTRLVSDWTRSRDACRSTACLRGAYLTGIGQLHRSPTPFDWAGQWWNTSATAGNGGRILIKHPAKWQYAMDVEAWGGSYDFDFSSGLDFYGGVALSVKASWDGDCTLILIPLPDGRLKVSSDRRRKCDALLPGALAFDGVYVKAAADPRPPATLLSLGLFPDRATDDRFRQLVGSDYQHYLTTATRFVYADDLDNLGATVLSLWYDGMANRRAAIVMFTPAGNMWALRVEPGINGRLNVHYATTEADKDRLPETLRAWRARFIDR